MENLKQGVFAKDKRGKFLFCNEVFAEAADLDSPTQIFGKGDQEMIWKEQAEKYLEGDQQIFRGLKQTSFIEKMTQKQRTASIWTTKSQLLDGTGNCIGVIGSFVDITDMALLPRKGYFDPNTRQYRLSGDLEGVSFSLSQYLVLKKLVLGLGAEQIARQINRSTRTVEDHINEIKFKLNCNQKSQIGEVAYRYGFIFDLISAE